VRDAMYSGISYAGPNYSRIELEMMAYNFIDFKGVRSRVENYIKSAYTYRRGISGTTADPSVTDEEGIFSWAMSKIRAAVNTIGVRTLLPGLVKKLSTQDPIMALSNVGDYIIGIAWSLAGVTVASGALSLGKLESATSFILFTFVMPLFAFGLSLAYFLPAIPFIRWMSGLGGWVILVVESLVAAPLWIAAHAMPEGEGAAGQHGKRGYLLMLAIFIRPPLMVAGFFCAVILLNVLGKMIGTGFEMFTAGVAQTKVVGITGTFAMLFILGITVMMLANKFFSLIHYLPEHVTNWIGQQFHSLGEKEDQAGAQGAFSTSGQAGAGVAGSVVKAGVEARKAARAEKNKNAGKGQSGTGTGYSERDFL